MYTPGEAPPFRVSSMPSRTWGSEKRASYTFMAVVEKGVFLLLLFYYGLILLWLQVVSTV